MSISERFQPLRDYIQGILNDTSIYRIDNNITLEFNSTFCDKYRLDFDIAKSRYLEIIEKMRRSLPAALARAEEWERKEEGVDEKEDEEEEEEEEE
jgi:hypothetical protein